MKWKRRMTILCTLMVLVLGLLGVSYAAHTSFLIADLDFSTSNMSFIFDKKNKNDVLVQIQNGSDGIARDLNSKASYDDKQLIISNIGPLDTEELQDGNAIITIKYSIKSEDEDKEAGIIQPASIKTNKDQGYDLGTVKFELMSDTPIWEINNEGRTWGSDTENIKGTPGIIYDLLPDSLGKFQVYHTLVPHSEDGVMIGTLVLEQIDNPDPSGVTEIGLSCLDLPDNIIEKIKKGESESILEIEGTYGFAIDLHLDQFNVER